MIPEIPTLEVQLPDLETLPTDNPPSPETETEEPAILEELIIEEVNIDGMCGVY